MTIRILIVDDHELVRAGLKSVLAQEPDLSVVAEASNGDEALAAVQRLHPDVVVLDLSLPGPSGPDLIGSMLAAHPGAKILVLTSFVEEPMVVGCLRAGAQGYMVKDVQSLDLKRDIRDVAQGKMVIDPKVSHFLMAHLRGPQRPAPGEPSLSPQQMEIVRLLAQGYSNREIAHKLFLSENTVKGYVADVLHKLEVKNRVEAAMLATRKGWV